MRKKGLSTIVVTLIIILISLVAVGIVWVVVRNVLKTGTEQVSSGLGQIFISLEIKNVKIEDNGDVSVQVTRNSGQGDLTGINFLLSDGTNSKLIKREGTLQELDTKTFTFTQTELGNWGFVKEVSVAPLIGESVGDVVDKLTFSNKEIIKNLGGVSWWKLDGDAKDEFDLNTGTLLGSVNFVDGKFGKAASFDGKGNITIPDSSSLNPSSAITVATWIYEKDNMYGANNWTAIRKANYEYLLEPGDFGSNYWAFLVDCSNCNIVNTSNAVTINAWHHITGTYDNSNLKIYIDGALSNTLSKSGNILVQAGPLLIGQWRNETFNGTIDEVMIFNKALTDSQVKSLYNSDLTNS